MMVKTEVIDTELREIGWRRFNLPLCTGYSPCRYHKGLDILIHKDPNYSRPHNFRPIFLFDIEANLHNKHLGKLMMNTEEHLNNLGPEQYGISKAKDTEIQAFNTRLLYNLTRLKRVPTTRTFTDLASN